MGGRAVLKEEEYLDMLEEIVRRDYYTDADKAVKEEQDDDDSSLDSSSASDDDDNDDDDDSSPVAHLPPTTLSTFHATTTSEDNEYFLHQHQTDLLAHRSAYAYAYSDKPLLLLPDGSVATHQRLLKMEATPLASNDFDLHRKGPLGTTKYVP